MTVDQAAEAVRALRPAIFYPYHYGEVEQVTDLDRLAREVAGLTEMRVRRWSDAIAVGTQGRQCDTAALFVVVGDAGVWRRKGEGGCTCPEGRGCR